VNWVRIGDCGGDVNAGILEKVCDGHDVKRLMEGQSVLSTWLKCME
jgi:hypothetical protein